MGTNNILRRRLIGIAHTDRVRNQSTTARNMNRTQSKIPRAMEIVRRLAAVLTFHILLKKIILGIKIVIAVQQAENVSYISGILELKNNEIEYTLNFSLT